MEQRNLKDLSILGKNLSQLRDIENLGRKMFQIWSDPLLSKTLSLTDKSNILATLLQENKWDDYGPLIPYITLPEMLRCVKILDSSRLKRQLSNKMTKDIDNVVNKFLYEPEKIPIKVEKITKKYIQLTEECDKLNEGLTFSLTSTRVKWIKSWVQCQTENELSFFALQFPLDKWRKLADLLHLNPNDDFQCKWFLSYCFNGIEPEGSIIYAANRLNQDFNRWYGEFNFPYSWIRLQKLNLSNNDKVQIVEKEGLKIGLWWYNELRCPEVDTVIKNKFEKGETCKLSYGSMVKLLSTLNEEHELYDILIRKIEESLKFYKMTIDSPVVVLGDASASMQIAIKTSGIITSLLTHLAKAELRLFRDKDYPQTPPSTVRESIKFGKEMIACKSTSPASSLHPYLVEQKVVKTFIVVTDEEENTGADGGWLSFYSDSNFAKIYKKYVETVYPARLVIISFSDPNNDQYMTSTLKKILNNNYEELVDVHKFDLNNPDLDRLDYVLEKLSIEI